MNDSKIFDNSEMKWVIVLKCKKNNAWTYNFVGDARSEKIKTLQAEKLQFTARKVVSGIHC